MIVVGAGLSGLTCARRLIDGGRPVVVLEAGDAVGGRVRTDQVNGFLLDRGFQVLLTAYPECRRTLDYKALELGRFRNGCLIFRNGRFRRLNDPWRHPLRGLATLFSPIGSPLDKLRVARLRRRSVSGSLDRLAARPETTSATALQRAGFSSQIMESFLRPFFGGIFLERELLTSSRHLEFVMRHLALGEAALPARGMQAIPLQLAARLPPGCLRFGASVDHAEANSVVLSSGERVSAKAVVIATDAMAAAGFTHELTAPAWNGVANLYFDAPDPPIKEPFLLVDGDGRGPASVVTVPSLAAPSYAPNGRSLISASVVGGTALADSALESAVRGQMRSWFGQAVDRWRHLATYDIPFALPAFTPPTTPPGTLPARLESGLFVCGDHRDTPSIQGAMASGRRAAEAVLAALVPR